MTALIATVALLTAALAAVTIHDITARRDLAELRGWILTHDHAKVVVTARPDATPHDLETVGKALLAGHIPTGGQL